MTDNIFEKGCLVQLSVSKWGGIKQIDKGKLAKMVQTTDHSWVTASKKLVEPASLKPICKISNSTRTWLNSKSLPFPITGMVFIPKDLITTVDTKLHQFKNDFDQAVEDFSNDYNYLREDAKEYLGNLFNEVDYPMDIISRFKFYWRFVILEIPNGESRLLSPEVYAREEAKFMETMEEARLLAVNALREEFAQMVEHISERFTQDAVKPKIFRKSAINNFYEYFQTFKDRNIFQDNELSQLVDRAQSILKGTSIHRIRSDNSLKEIIRSGMADIENSIAETFNRPRRQIIMD
ncbi:conserved hypothetical protein [Desulfamplus magnetovallimortis]|uniref:DUF3150 domain-containing protein n=1 Tax=Desulfamplus magnetovallimortis TaxID=1246637 RepID=A0A1W1HED3_9BACT|nr:DUF3150 domain-containing protein [Desulfamplus magnetovallimortis]SLM30861.1 conserved hypothetical protein [Desulfamplus magnetovallimortis]